MPEQPHETINRLTIERDKAEARAAAAEQAVADLRKENEELVDYKVKVTRALTSRIRLMSEILDQFSEVPGEPGTVTATATRLQVKTWQRKVALSNSDGNFNSGERS